MSNTGTLQQIEITEPGIYDMPEADYHADPVPGGSLSASGCKTILKAPAKFNHEQLQGNPVRKDVFDFGSAAHALVLGVGAEIVVIDAPDWRTKDAKQAKADAYAAGQVPILAKDHRIVQAMADVLHAHPIAGALLDGTKGGKAEQSMFWQADGIWKRALADWLPVPIDGERFIVTDYKTAADEGAEVNQFSKSVVNYGYASQAAWYLEGAMTLLGVKDPAFLFVCQEKVAPYLVSVVELSAELLLMGEQRNAQAVRLFKECRATGVWPGYPDRVQLATAPTWASYAHEADLNLWGVAT